MIRNMKRLIPLVVFAVGALFAAEPPRWLTISTLLGEREEEIAKDIRFLGKETIVDAVAFSCTLVPEGDPVVDKAALLAPRFRKMHELLKGSGVKEGILFQATMGHGWKPNSPAKGQKVILPDGNEKYKFCPLDKTFLDYIAGQAKTIGELKPDYFMVDDDTRLITGVGGCFCPLHLQAISAKSGKAFQTRQELQAALKADAALRAQWDEVLRDGIAELMKVIRAQIPSEIPGEFCCCADDAHHAGLMAQLLAAPGQQPVVRINNARYMLDGRRDFMDTLAKTSAQIADLPAGTIVLDEADPCPQNRYSMGATELVHHLVMNTLEGCGGAKIWLTRLGNAHETASGRAYRELFRRQKGYMEQIAALTLVRDGVRIPLAAPDPHRAMRARTAGVPDWGRMLFGRLGVPYTYGRVSKGGVTALCGAQVPLFSDDELRTILSGAVLLDGDAAVRLAQRGFGKLTGVEAKAWSGRTVSAERFETETSWGTVGAAADFTALDAKARRLSTYLHRVSGVTKDTVELAPGSYLFENELGGRVFAFAAYLPGHLTLERFFYHNETRKRAVLAALRLLAGGTVPGGVAYPGDAEVLLETGVAADGRRIVVVDNIGIDALERIDLDVAHPPAEIRRLADDGSWRPVVFTRDGNRLVLDTKAETLRPAVLAFTTPKACAPAPLYGVCAHVTRSEGSPARLKGTLDAMEAAGMRYVRSDIDHWAVRRKDGTYDFSDYDRVFAEVDRRGMTFLPIYYGPWGRTPPKTEAEFAQYKAYLTAIVSRYGRRMPVVEIWNEANIGFFEGSDPVVYAQVLKAAYEAVKAVDPAIRVAFTGTAGVPHDWIRKVFEAGGNKYFDVMNVHPYSHPAQPERAMDANTEKLRRLMAEFGCADKPIWYTEIGWPTHTVKTDHAHVLLAGLKVARPEQKSWNVLLADLQGEGTVPENQILADLRDILPAGSTVRICSQKDLVSRLAEGGVDAVVYPFDESFPADTVDAVNAFVKKGGVLVDFGGLPCYFGRRDGIAIPGMQHGGAMGRFPFGYRAWWTDKKGTYPESAQLHATAAGAAAGVKQEPTGFKAIRFLAPDRIGKDSEWIPLVAGKTTNGVELVGAAVVRYKGERTGAAVLCSLASKGSLGTNNEENQARFTARGLAIACAMGVESYFTYNLRSAEEDPFYSEHHFGLMHADFTPKPAYAAYAAFTKARPDGSVQKPGDWRDEKGEFFFPQWTRPDGKKAGMVWSVFPDAGRRLAFTGGTPVFTDMYGRRIGVREVEKGVYSVPVSNSPVYFRGAELAK